MLDVRPRPQDVRDWFVHEVDDATLHAYLGALHADPDWLMIPWPGATSVDVALFYGPTNEQLDVYLLQAERDGRTVWRRAEA